MSAASHSILVVDDDVAVGKVMCALLTQAGFGAALVDSGETALKEFERRAYDLVLTDVRMPGMGGVELLKVVSAKYAIPVVLISAHGTFDLAVEALRLGAADFIKKPFERDEIVFVMKKVLQGSEQARNAPPRVQRSESSEALQAILGRAPAIESLRQQIRKVATTPATVLIRGESGTGKELVATALHQLSPRAKGPLVRLNCGALTESLLESELFGHEKGAFTGAVQRKPGRAELAHGGTLFLDEIGDVTPALQVKLLRLLQEKQFERVGGTETLSVDVRFVAATHQPLEDMVKRGAFREDLFYRLNVVPLSVPPLRERSEDLEVLVDHFLKTLATTHGREVRCDPEVLAALKKRSWPGNIRELQNLMERLVVLADGDRITLGDLPPELNSGSAAGPEAGGSLASQRQNSERDAVKQAISKAKGNRSVAARLLGISRRTLYNKLETLGLENE